MELYVPAKKAARQSVKRYSRNHSIISSVRTSLNNANKAINTGEKELANAAVHSAISHLDIAVKKRVLHKNTASRNKSRLAIRLNKMPS